MGQLVWYWQWPPVFDWDLTPAKLFEGQMAEGVEIATLLGLCAEGVGTFYDCKGSFTIPDWVGIGLRGKPFNFKTASNESAVYDWGIGLLWNEGNWAPWLELMRTEIICGRPVIYKGEKNLISGEKHFFILDGFDNIFFPMFHINFGWKGKYNDVFFYLWEIKSPPGEQQPFDFRKMPVAIVGISPTYASMENITDSYAGVASGGRWYEDARQNISLPAQGKEYTVESGALCNFIAGNSITLKPGFHAKAGSKFTAKIEPSYLTTNMEISVSGWPTEVYCGNALTIYTHNANSFEFMVKNSSDNIVWRHVDAIYFEHGSPALWWLFLEDDCPPPGVYSCTVRLRNNYGRKMDHTWNVTLKDNPEKSNDNPDPDGKSMNASDNIDVEFSFITDTDVIVYPNPSGGTVQTAIAKPFANYNLKMYNTAGVLVYESKNIVQPTYSFDISAFADGTYTIQLDIDNQRIVKKLMLAK
jgi:hypothetical protein